MALLNYVLPRIGNLVKVGNNAGSGWLPFLNMRALKKAIAMMLISSDYQHDPVSLLSTLFFVSVAKITLNLPALRIYLILTPQPTVEFQENPDTLNEISGHLCICAANPCMHACVRSANRLIIARIGISRCVEANLVNSGRELNATYPAGYDANTGHWHAC